MGCTTSVEAESTPPAQPPAPRRRSDVATGQDTLDDGSLGCQALRLPPARTSGLGQRRRTSQTSFAIVPHPEVGAESTARAQGATDATLVLLGDVEASSATAVAAQNHHARNRSSGSLRTGSVLRFSPLTRASTTRPGTGSGDPPILSPLTLSGANGGSGSPPSPPPCANLATESTPTTATTLTGASSPAASLP